MGIIPINQYRFGMGDFGDIGIGLNILLTDTDILVSVYPYRYLYIGIGRTLVLTLIHMTCSPSWPPSSLQ